MNEIVPGIVVREKLSLEWGALRTMIAETLNGRHRCRVTNGRFLAVWFWSIGLLCALVGCDRSGDEDLSAVAGKTSTAEVSAELGAVRFRATLSPNPARLSDEVRLIFELEAPQDLSVSMPPFGQSLDDYVIRDFREEPPTVLEERQRLRHEYVLEPGSPGQHQLGPFTLKWDVEGNRRQELATEEMVSEVITVIAEEVPSLDGLGPATAPIALPDERPSFWWFILGFGGLVLLTVLVVFWMNRKKQQPIEVATPRENAQNALRDLRSSGLEARDGKRFFTELSMIVRRFIEDSTGVLAAEQTTEEFLRDPGTRRLFASDEQDQLRAFLETADLVKFARHLPDRSSVDRAWAQAWAFVDFEPVSSAAESVLDEVRQ